jgi:predicted ABC-type transport system involved in lysophospholipase L1 biosynthesis ATPase subunit
MLPRMPDSLAPAIHIRDVQKDYRALRPLRVRELDIREGESIALLGFDRAAAEVFVNLLTAATVPDAGRIEIFGRPTVDIEDADTWLSSLDCFGIVSERQVLVDNMTVEENLTMPLTMALHDVDSAVHAKVAAVAEEVGLSSDQLHQPVGGLNAGSRLRVRLGRALAPDPRILLSEHPNASLDAGDLARFAAEYARLVRRRGIVSVVLTADTAFASAVARRILTLQPATGELKPLSAWRRLLHRS